MTEQDALVLATWFAGAAFVASMSALVLTQLARSTRRVRWITFCGVACGVAFILFAFVAFTFVM